MKKIKMIVFGYGQRGRTYASYAKAHPDQYEVVAIVENNPRVFGWAQRDFSCPIYTDYRQMLADKLQADIVFVATQDKDHAEHAEACMKAGYDLLLEKPIASTEEDCRRIHKTAKEYGRKVFVAHVLRYTPFYRQIKQIVAAGELGEIVSIHASENVGYAHQSHSYVRGPWRNSKTSSPMILAKCCHDLDIFRWLMDKPCQSVCSFGSLRHFRKEFKPEGAAAYCSDCPLTDCVYKAQRHYENNPVGAGYFSAAKKKEEIMKDLEKSQYDRCVYQSDNDVVDHQVSILQFEDGATVCHTMTAFSQTTYRDIKIYGTKAELVGVMEENFIEVRPFGAEKRKITWENGFTVGGHSGGDEGIMYEIYLELNGQPTYGITHLDVSVESHYIAFAVENSRVSGGAVQKIEN